MSSKLKRLVLAITLLCGLSILGIACNANDSTDVELIPVSIALDWFPWANHSGLYVAKENGNLCSTLLHEISGVQQLTRLK